MMNHGRYLLMVAMLAMLFCGWAPAESLKAGQMRSWLAGLADADPATRQASWQALLGLKRGDLDALREVIAGSTPLLPSQSAALAEIVMHVFLTEESYPQQQDGFIGIRMMEANFPAAGGQADRYGVIVVERHIGFSGYRMLLNGDIIVGVVEDAGVPIQRANDLALIVQRYRAGRTIHLQVLRQGQVLDIPVTLAPRPNMPEDQMRQLNEQRRVRAQAYWQQWFAPLLQERLSRHPRPVGGRREQGLDLKSEISHLKFEI